MTTMICLPTAWLRVTRSDDVIGKHVAVHHVMVGRERGEHDFYYLWELGVCLRSAGSFDLDRMRFA